MKNTQLMHEQAEVFAQSIVEKQNGFKFEDVFQYTHENGDVIYWKLRVKAIRGTRSMSQVTA